MFKVTKEIRWEMGHRLIDGYEGKCNSLHGHSWVARVHLEGPELDGFGMLFDFGDFTPLRAWVDEHWDHATMLNASDPLALALSPFRECRLYIVPGNPTSERIARELYNKAAELLPVTGQTLIAYVDVLETCTSMASYTGMR